MPRKPFEPSHTARNWPAIIMLMTLVSVACQREDPEAKKRIQPVYDKTTGKLQLLKYDSNGNGTADTFSYMDGARVVRIEIDTDEDGKVDRWEYYGADQTLEKVGFSRQRDGKEDAWSFAGPDGAIVKIEMSTRRDGTVTRTEYYEAGRLIRAEEDTNFDGRIDKWETYVGERLASVAFDTVHRGAPDRRLVYAADGSARMEVDDTGAGRFVALDESRSTNHTKPNPRAPIP